MFLHSARPLLPFYNEGFDRVNMIVFWKFYILPRDSFTSGYFRAFDLTMGENLYWTVGFPISIF